MLLLLAPREGRLVATPLETKHYERPEACAKTCLGYPATVCYSFNYDYSSQGSCELLSHVEGNTAKLRKVWEIT